MNNKPSSCGPVGGVVGQRLDEPLNRLLSSGIYFDKENNQLVTESLSIFCVYPDGSADSKISLDGNYSLQDLQDIIAVVRVLSSLPNPIDQRAASAPLHPVVGQSICPVCNKPIEEGNMSSTGYIYYCKACNLVQ